MIVYRCDVCEVDITDGSGGGTEMLRLGRVVIEAQASIAIVREVETYEVPTVDNRIHVCSKCVLNAIRNGERVRWNLAERVWEEIAK